MRMQQHSKAAAGHHLPWWVPLSSPKLRNHNPGGWMSDCNVWKMYITSSCTSPSSLDWPLIPQCWATFHAGYPHAPEVSPALSPMSGNAGSLGDKSCGGTSGEDIYLHRTKLRPSSSSSIRSKSWFSSAPDQCSADGPTYFTSMMWWCESDL